MIMFSMKRCNASWFMLQEYQLWYSRATASFWFFQWRVVLGHTQNIRKKAFFYFFPFPYSHYFLVRNDIHLPKHTLQFFYMDIQCIYDRLFFFLDTFLRFWITGVTISSEISSYFFDMNCTFVLHFITLNLIYHVLFWLWISLHIL